MGLKIRRIRSKKGVFFTMLAIALLSLLLATYTFYAAVKDRKAVQKRVYTLNNFVFAVEKDLPRKLYISGFRIIFLFEKKITETGSYITNIDARFQEVFFNATFNGALDPDTTTLMQDATFSAINDALQENAEKINAKANLSEPSINLSQSDPWNIKVTLTAKLSIKDNANLASWNRTAVIVAYIPIENFEDPLYIKSTNGTITNKINQTPYSVPIPSINLLSHTENSYYIGTTDAPSFLKRLQGDLSADANGIESLVYLPKLTQQGISVEEKSIADHIYFSTNNPSPLSIPAGMPAWLKLDSAHAGTYGV